MKTCSTCGEEYGVTGDPGYCPFCSGVSVEKNAKASAIEDFQEHFEKDATLENDDIYEQALHLAVNQYQTKQERETFVDTYAKAYEAEAVQHDIFPFNR
jgi:uncharacterized Zn finger protein (UPF0148 family)